MIVTILESRYRDYTDIKFQYDEVIQKSDNIVIMVRSFQNPPSCRSPRRSSSKTLASTMLQQALMLLHDISSLNNDEFKLKL